jgi:plastocyanin
MQTTPKPAEAPKAKSNTWKLVAIVVVILIVVGVAAYILTIKPVSTANVVIQDDSACGLNDTGCLFNPASYNATVNGATVSWRNDGGVNHTVTTNSTQNGSLPTFDSGSVGHNGGTYSHAFTVAGTYHYYCTIHPWMKGVIVAK